MNADMTIFSKRVLEFDRLCEVIASYAAAAPTVERLKALNPYRSVRRAGERKDGIADAIRLRKAEKSMPATRFDCPNEALNLVAPEDAVLDTDGFLMLRSLLEAGHTAVSFLAGGTCKDYPGLAALGDLMPRLDDLHEAITRVFNVDGEILDRASPRLAEVRHGIGRLERRIRSRLDSLLRDDKLSDAIHDGHIAIRNGRYVIPIKREQKSQLKGVVHDQSNSGRTLFMEPSLTLEEGNELASLKLEERDEIIRILATLSRDVRRDSKRIRALFQDLILYDGIRSISAWAVAYGCRFADWGQEIVLKNARHPLLHEQFRREGHEDDLVPLSLRLPENNNVLVITGSNTGGKTVILKTVGLLTLAALCDLPVPCEEGTVLRKFDAVLADIGDEQSIEQNLSTFSSHLTHIRDIINISRDRKSLVLLDEIGSGTDPAEGAAIGCAVLDELTERDSVTLATTHLAGIKHYVHEHEMMSNGCVLFNEKTLSPEYQLVIGRPGASHAMTIARRIGVPDVVLKRAETFLDKEQLRLESLLAQLDAEQHQLHSNLSTAEQARKQIERERQELSDELTMLRKERKRMLNQAQREAAAIVDNSRKEMERLIREAGKSAKQDKEKVKQIRERAEKKKESLSKGIEQTADKPAEPLKPEDVNVGDRVWVEVLKDHATVTSLTRDKKRAHVEVKGMDFQVKTKELGRPKEEPEPEERTPNIGVSKPKNSEPAKTELKMLGMRVDTGLQELERFLDNAALHGLDQVRLVHGFGTGALREAVHAYLRTCPVVEKFRLGRPEKDEGGAGVTWVELK